MALSGVKIKKLLALPLEPISNQFYLIETGDIVELYLSDSKANLHLLNEYSSHVHLDGGQVAVGTGSDNIGGYPELTYSLGLLTTQNIKAVGTISVGNTAYYASRFINGVFTSSLDNMYGMYLDLISTSSGLYSQSNGIFAKVDKTVSNATGGITGGTIKAQNSNVTSQTMTGLAATTYNKGASSSIGYLNGLIFSASNEGAVTAVTNCVNLDVYNGGAGNMAGITSGVTLTMRMNGIVDERRGINLAGWFSGGTIAKSYGIYMDTTIDGGTLRYAIYSSALSQSYMAGNLGLGSGITTPTAKLHLAAGTATAGTAPIRLTTGTPLTTPSDGVFEYHTSHLYFTIGSTRYQLDRQGGITIGSTAISSGTNDRVLFQSGGVVSQSGNLTFDGNDMVVTGKITSNGDDKGFNVAGGYGYFRKISGAACTLYSSGSLNIAAAGQIDLQGRVRISSDFGSYLEFSGSGTTAMYFQHFGGYMGGYVLQNAASVVAIRMATSPTGNPLEIQTSGGTAVSAFNASGFLGIGVVASLSAAIQARRTTEQLRLEYDASNYTKFTVGSTGTLTIDNVGSVAKTVFSDPVEGPKNGYGIGWLSSPKFTTESALYDYFADMGIVKNNATFGAPTTTDDDAAGYSHNSLWTNIAGAPDVYVCKDPSFGAAVWTKIA